MHAQEFHLGVRAGGMAYNGDLNEGTISSTLKIVRPSFGLMADISINRFLCLEGTITYGELTGDDEFSSRRWMNERNLSFKTPLLDIQLGGKWYLFRMWQPDPKFDIFGRIGGSMFFFNPKANYAGVWYDLQPLGTEGQGIEGFAEPYRRLGLSFYGGFGGEYQLTEYATIGLDFVIAVTNSDYIDDVSTDYVNYNVLLENNGPITAALADRTGEFFGEPPRDIPTGTRRGSPSINDHFASGAFFFKYNLGYFYGSKELCPKF